MGYGQFSLCVINKEGQCPSRDINRLMMMMIKKFITGRSVTLILFVSLTVLYAAYTANIVVLLRTPSSSIRTLKDLLHSPLEFGASDFEYNRYFFKVRNMEIFKIYSFLYNLGLKFVNILLNVQDVRSTALHAIHLQFDIRANTLEMRAKPSSKCIV
jgi:hypothetical protein